MSTPHWCSLQLVISWNPALNFPAISWILHPLAAQNVPLDNESILPASPPLTSTEAVLLCSFRQTTHTPLPLLSDCSAHLSLHQLPPLPSRTIPHCTTVNTACLFLLTLLWPYPHVLPSLRYCACVAPWWWLLLSSWSLHFSNIMFLHLNYCHSLLGTQDSFPPSSYLVLFHAPLFVIPVPSYWYLCLYSPAPTLLLVWRNLVLPLYLKTLLGLSTPSSTQTHFHSPIPWSSWSFSSKCLILLTLGVTPLTFQDDCWHGIL